MTFASGQSSQTKRAAPRQSTPQSRNPSNSGPRLSRAFVRVALDGGGAQEIDATFMDGDLFRAVLPTNGAAAVDATPCATDRQGNEGCGVTQSYSLDGSSGPSGNDSAGAGGGGATGGSGGSADDDGFHIDDGGCGCRAGDQGPSVRAAWLLLLGLVGGLRRRGRWRR